MEAVINELFNQEIKGLFKDRQEIIKFIFNHERKHLCIKNLCRELKHLEYTTITTNRQLLEVVVRDFARLFAKAAIENKEFDLLSKAEQLRIINEDTQAKEQLKEWEKLDAGVQYTNDKRIQPDDYTVSI